VLWKTKNKRRRIDIRNDSNTPASLSISIFLFCFFLNFFLLGGLDDNFHFSCVYINFSFVVSSCIVVVAVVVVVFGECCWEEGGSGHQSG
jgi:hypothetical protein